MLKQQQVCTCLSTTLIKFYCLHMLYLKLNITCENFKFYFKQVSREEENIESFKRDLNKSGFFLHVFKLNLLLGKRSSVYKMWYFYSGLGSKRCP